MQDNLLLFDLDGTLSDPLVGIAGSINYALVHFGHAPVDETKVAAYVGPPLDGIFKAITGLESSAPIAELVAKYRERYSDVGYSENTLYQGIPELLEKMTTSGIPLGLCTAKPQDIAVRILDMFDLRHHFQFVNGGDIGVHKGQQIETLKAEGLVTASSLMIGDRDSDLIAAHRNGLSSAGVLWGYGSRKELENENPRYLFNAPHELEQLITAPHLKPAAKPALSTRP